MHKNTLQHFLRGGGKYPLLPMHQIFGAWSTLEELRNQQLIYESPERISFSFSTVKSGDVQGQSRWADLLYTLTTPNANPNPNPNQDHITL